MTETLETYRRELLRWNERINLIGPEVKSNLQAHIAEALEAAAILQPEREVLDFGSGGGLPAIPMAIAAPKARFHLIESDQKKWAFLKHVVRTCKLNAVVYGERLDRAARGFPPDLQFSLVTSRAVGRPQEWLPLLASHMEPGGHVALFQSGEETPEIEGFHRDPARRLARGFLAMFHVEQR